MKKAQRSSFKLNPIAAAIAMAMASQFPANVALAGSGWGSGANTSNQPVSVQTYYANSPSGPAPVLTKDPITGLATTTLDPVTQLPLTKDTGKALRKFVDTLPGLGSANANNLGQYIPVAVPEKWVDGNGNATNDDYYEIAAVEYAEQMHSDLPKATHLRGYVQIATPGAVAAAQAVNSTFTPLLFTTLDGRQLSVMDKPHHLGPIIKAASGVAVRMKFTNYLPIGGNLFLPVDKSITGAGKGPDGTTYYTENRAEIHLVGGQAPWISAGSPHQWVAPVGETAKYTKGASTQNLPDMADPGAGSTTLYFPNTQSARFMFYQDRTSGLTRLNSYAGLEAGYLVTDPTEAGLVASGAIPADQIPLIIEDKTFVPGNISQQDAKWDATHWGQPGDLWFPHVYETNQDPNSVNATNPVGRWDFGPWFWPIFAATQPLPTGGWNATTNMSDASFTPEAYQDTPVINGTAYPTLTVDPKAYRFRILNASNDRYLNLGLYRADTTVQAPQLDINGNPIFDGSGKQLFFTNTEVKMVPAVADVNGAPLTPSNSGIGGVAYDPTCLCQYPALPQLQPAIQFSGPNRAWPIDGRVGGAPDPAAVGPDFIAIGSDGGFLPNPVDIPSQPVTYESNRRSITVTNVYGYGLLVGPSERTDVVVDFSAYAGQTLILYNDAPAPFPFNDQRDDYFTGDSDLTGSGGAYSTKPGYGPNTRTMMQIKVNAAPVGTTPAAFNANALLTALPAAYAASQPAPIVPESAYNTAFGTADSDNYAHVATGSVAQPNLDFTTSGKNGSVTAVNLISSGGQLIVGTNNIVGNAIPGSGQGYDLLNPPIVVFNNGTCLPATGVTAAATATVDASSHQVTAVTVTANGSGYTCAPTITFTNPPGTSGVGAQAAPQMTVGTQSILVQTKSEQELFDASGRYNSTGGVELPLTSGTTQTTVPLNYTDSPTEFIGDSEVQLWKIVDNGFWSNSMHFDFVDVQLINRVGWDGTVKAPASNEVGWKDTLRLNPLEDVIVAMRAKHPATPFGMPASKRYQDPSLPNGATNRTSQLPFLADPGVTSPAGASLLTTTVNTNVVVNNMSKTSAKSTLGYDNEYVWNSAILGHSEDDFIRPVVYHPTVIVPDAPANLADNSGVLNWTDTTPAGAASTLGNPKNEIRFDVNRWIVSLNTNNKYILTQFAPLGSTLANATAFTDTTRVAGTSYVYQVKATNNAGSGSSGIAELTAPAAPASLTDTFNATTSGRLNTSTPVTLQWPVSTSVGVTGYLVSITNALGATSVVLVTSNTTNTVNGIVSYKPALALNNVYSITVQAQIALTQGQTIAVVNSVPTAAVSVDLTLLAAPTTPTVSNVTTTGLALNWSAVTGATGYTLQYSTNGTSWSNMGTNGVNATLTGASATVTGLKAATNYYFQVAAIGIIGNTALPGIGLWSTPPATQLTAPAAPTLSVGAGSVTASGFTVNWTAPTGATSYNVTVTATVGGVVSTTTQNVTSNTLAVTADSGTSSTVNVAACDNGGTICSAASNTVTQWTLPAVPVISGVTNVTASSMTISWGAVTGATTYALQYSINGGAWTNVNATLNGASATVAGLVANTSYSFQVRAKDAAGYSTYSTASAPQLTLLRTPTGVQPRNGTTIGTPYTGGLSWNAVTGATSYSVSWTGVAGTATAGITGSATAISGQQLTFTVSGTYLMNVTAISTNNTSAPSASVSVTVQ